MKHVWGSSKGNLSRVLENQSNILSDMDLEKRSHGIGDSNTSNSAAGEKSQSRSFKLENGGTQTVFRGLSPDLYLLCILPPKSELPENPWSQAPLWFLIPFIVAPFSSLEEKGTPMFFIWVLEDVLPQRVMTCKKLKRQSKIMRATLRSWAYRQTLLNTSVNISCFLVNWRKTPPTD